MVNSIISVYGILPIVLDTENRPGGVFCNIIFYAVWSRWVGVDMDIVRIWVKKQPLGPINGSCLAYGLVNGFDSAANAKLAVYISQMGFDRKGGYTQLISDLFIG